MVNYEGTGAYFLDKVNEGTWRLELMPDVIQLADPFEKASPKKAVREIIYSTQLIEINLPDLELNFETKGVNKENFFNTTSGAISCI